MQAEDGREQSALLGFLHTPAHSALPKTGLDGMTRDSTRAYQGLGLCTMHRMVLLFSLLIVEESHA